MTKKKLYSFRAEPELLTALRQRADHEKTTVAELIRKMLLEGLATDPVEPTSTTEVYELSPKKTSSLEIKEELLVAFIEKIEDFLITCREESLTTLREEMKEFLIEYREEFREEFMIPLRGEFMTALMDISERDLSNSG